MILTIDTFAWVEVCRGTALGERARAAMQSADQCLTPAIVLAELARVFHRRGFSDEVIGAQLLAVREASKVVAIDPPIAIGAAHAVAELQSTAIARNLGAPGLGDGLVLATARHFGSGLLTGDPHFRDCLETVWVG